MMPLEKLDLLEQRVTKMIELVTSLKAQNHSLEEQVTKLNNQVQTLTQELEHGHQKISSLPQLQEENQHFQEERGQVYAKLEAMLNDLEGMEM